MIMIANGQDNEVTTIDVGIGDIYLSLCCFDEAVFSYQKALTVFKSTRGENHPSVASVFIRLADLNYKKGKLRESKSYCENALRIYAKPLPGIIWEEIASRLTEISAIYEAVNEPEEALNLLQKAMKLLEDTAAQRSTIAGIEAQMGVMFYRVGRVEGAIEILEHILKVRQEKLGTAHSDFDNEKKRLADLLKEAGRARNRKGKSLENLLGSNSHQRTKKEGVKRWAGFGHKT